MKGELEKGWCHLTPAVVCVPGVSELLCCSGPRELRATSSITLPERNQWDASGVCSGTIAYHCVPPASKLKCWPKPYRAESPTRCKTKR